MAKKDPKQILWENVSALMTKRYGKENLGRLAADAGIGAASMTRLKKQDTSAGIDTVAAIAEAFGIQPWQLLIDGLVADELPSLASKETSWPFQDIKPSQFYDLQEIQRTKIEGAVMHMVSQFENVSQSVKPPKVNTPLGRSGLSAGTQKRVQTTSQDLKSLRETTHDVPTNKLPDKGKARPGTDKKA